MNSSPCRCSSCFWQTGQRTKPALRGLSRAGVGAGAGAAGEDEGRALLAAAEVLASPVSAFLFLRDEVNDDRPKSCCREPVPRISFKFARDQKIRLICGKGA
jgi:hypothetical protein